jgi:hypothetical protein
MANNVVLLSDCSDSTQGFEEWDSVSGGGSSSTAWSRTGPRSYAVFGSGPGYLEKNGVLDDAGRRISFAFRMTALPSASTAYICSFVTSGGTVLFYLSISSSGHLQLLNGSTSAQIGSDGTTALAADTDYRISISYTITSTSVNEIRVFLDGGSEISVTDGSLSNTGTNRFWIGIFSAVHWGSDTIYFDDIYIDDGSDLTDTGDVHVTYKAPATVNNNNFDTTGGSGAVNERPINETNYKQQAGTSQVNQDYTLENAATGDEDITGATIVAYKAWIWAKRGSGGAGSPNLILNGTTYPITVATGSAQYFEQRNLSSSYPTAANGVGLQSGGGSADYFLYECGAQIAYIPAAGDVTVTPSPVSVVASAIIGAIILGSLALTPSPAAAIGRVVDPAVLQHYTLTATEGSYTLTGADLTFYREYQLSLPAGSYTVTGADSGLVAGRLLSLGTGSYIVTGSDAVLQLARSLVVNAGSYVVTGSDATMLKHSLLSLGASNYAITGSDTDLRRGRQLVALAGSYTITGSNATLLADRVLVLNPGTYSITGFDATLQAGPTVYSLDLGAGSYLITGAPLTLLANRVITAGVGSYTVTGFPATVLATRVLSLDAGSYLITGSNANTVKGYVLSLGTGDYLVTGADAQVLKEWVLSLDSGSYNMVGYDVVLDYSGAVPYMAYDPISNKAWILMHRIMRLR